jgi:regulator of PEP synthase PpsR (kinase-PPPase family)
MHDDLGISRTSKTPTSIYLAQRGYKTTNNLPLVRRSRCRPR